MIDAAARRLIGVADQPRREARLLLAHTLGITVEAVLRDPDRRVETADFDTLIARRMAHAPIAHLLGRAGFWTLDLKVSPATLIPRPDSETLVQTALALSADPSRVLDLGTGSGCLLLAVLAERPLAWGVGIDRSEAALRIARQNADACALSARSVFVAGDWSRALDGGFDLVLANPPYIPTDDIAGLMADVRDHEPRAALDGGADGLACYRAILADLGRVMRTDGVAVFEIAQGQADAVRGIAAEHGFVTEMRSDLAGIARVVMVTAGHAGERRIHVAAPFPVIPGPRAGDREPRG